MMRNIICLMTVCLQLYAADEVPLPESGYTENFNCFEGSHATLPEGTSVSKDGSSPMPEDDADFRGINDGHVSTAGCYAWQLDDGDRALGYQPSTDEFTPGWFRLSFSNSSDRAYRFLKIRYDVVCLNNENRSTELRLSVVMPSGETLSPDSMTYTSPAQEKPGAVWTHNSRSCCIKLPSPVESGQSFSIYWRGDDVSGSGSRDEYGIDNLEVKGIFTRGTVVTIR